LSTFEKLDVLISFLSIFFLDPAITEQIVASVSASLQHLNYGALRVFNIMNKQRAKLLTNKDVAK